MNARMGQARLRAVCPAMPQREQPMSSCIFTSTAVPAALHLRSRPGCHSRAPDCSCKPQKRGLATSGGGGCIAELQAARVPAYLNLGDTPADLHLHLHRLARLPRWSRGWSGHSLYVWHGIMVTTALRTFCRQRGSRRAVPCYVAQVSCVVVGLREARAPGICPGELRVILCHSRVRASSPGTVRLEHINWAVTPSLDSWLLCRDSER